MAKHKKSTFFKDFKAFISKGNVVDMAVGVVIGGAFGKIVTGLVNYIINPFVGLFVKSGSLDSLKTVIHEATYKADGVTVDQAEVAILWGTWLQTIIDFLITALCIFVVLRIIVKAKNLAEYKKTMEAEAKAETIKAILAEVGVLHIRRRIMKRRKMKLRRRQRTDGIWGKVGRFRAENIRKERTE